MCLDFKQSENSFQTLRRVSTTAKMENQLPLGQFSFEGQKPTMTAFGTDGTPSSNRMTSRDYEAEETLLLRKHLRRSQSAVPEPETKKSKCVALMA